VGYEPFCVEMFQGDGGVRAGVAKDFDPIGIDPDLDGFPYLVAAVIHDVDGGFLNGFVGIIENALGLALLFPL
jgi:hypothetical protein